MADDTTATVEETTDAPSIDIDKAVGQISESLFPEHEAPTPTESVAEALVTKDTPKAATPTLTTPPVPEVSTPPKSWPKDMHPHWQAVPKAVQDYYQTREKQFLDGTQQFRNEAESAKEIHKVLAPYEPLLQSKGLAAPQAIGDMLDAYTRLTQGTMAQRQQALQRVATNFRIEWPGTTPEALPQSDPRVETLEQQFNSLQQALQKQALDKTTAEVTAFASDPAHALFDEVSDDIIKLIGAGFSLQESYDKAIWANEVTREKQMAARIQTETEKALERKRLDALPKQKARGVNVNGRDTQRTPTDPLGSMDDTLRSTLKTIKERTVH